MAEAEEEAIEVGIKIITIREVTENMVTITTGLIIKIGGITTINGTIKTTKVKKSHQVMSFVTEEVVEVMLLDLKQQEEEEVVLKIDLLQISSNDFEINGVD